MRLLGSVLGPRQQQLQGCILNWVPQKPPGDEDSCARDLLGSATSQTSKEVGKWDQKGKEAQQCTLSDKSLRDNFGSAHKRTPLKVTPTESSWAGARGLEHLYLCTHQLRKKGMGVGNLPGTSSSLGCRQSRLQQP